MRSVLGSVIFLLVSASFAFGAQDSAGQSNRYRACLAKAQSTPSQAYEDALVWQTEGGASPARHCVAMALLGMGAYAEGAEKLEALAYAPDVGSEALGTRALAQSGEAWLQARRPKDALRVLTSAIEHDENNAEIYTNRARALMALEKPDAARTDLDAAIRLRPRNPLALRLRASVLLAENDLDGAQSDISTALGFEPTNVDALLVRGQIREAQRLQ